MRDASSAPVRSANPEPPEDDDQNEVAPARLQVTGRNLLVICGFFAASLAALYYLLPQLAGLQDTWHRIEDGSPWWMLLALAFTLAHVRRLRDDVPRRLRPRRDARADRLARELPDHDGRAGGVADLRRRRRRRARADGVGAAACGHAPRQVADKTLSFLILTYFPYVVALIVCGLGLRLGIFPGAAPFGLTVVPAILAVIALAIGLSIALVPTDLQRRVGRVVAGRRPDGAARRSRLAQLPAAASAGMRDAIAHVAQPRPGAARRVRVLGVPDPRAVGGLQGVRRRTDAGRC